MNRLPSCSIRIENLLSDNYRYEFDTSFADIPFKNPALDPTFIQERMKESFPSSHPKDKSGWYAFRSKHPSCAPMDKDRSLISSHGRTDHEASSRENEHYIRATVEEILDHPLTKEVLSHIFHFYPPSTKKEDPQTPISTIRIIEAALQHKGWGRYSLHDLPPFSSSISTLSLAKAIYKKLMDEDQAKTEAAHAAASFKRFVYPRARARRHDDSSLLVVSPFENSEAIPNSCPTPFSFAPEHPIRYAFPQKRYSGSVAIKNFPLVNAEENSKVEEPVEENETLIKATVEEILSHPKNKIAISKIFRSCTSPEAKAEPRSLNLTIRTIETALQNRGWGGHILHDLPSFSSAIPSLLLAKAICERLMSQDTPHKEESSNGYSFAPSIHNLSNTSEGKNNINLSSQDKANRLPPDPTVSLLPEFICSSVQQDQLHSPSSTTTPSICSNLSLDVKAVQAIKPLQEEEVAAIGAMITSHSPEEEASRTLQQVLESPHNLLTLKIGRDEKIPRHEMRRMLRTIFAIQNHHIPSGEKEQNRTALYSMLHSAYSRSCHKKFSSISPRRAS